MAGYKSASFDPDAVATSSDAASSALVAAASASDAASNALSKIAAQSAAWEADIAVPYVSASPPNNPTDGTLWWDIDDATGGSVEDMTELYNQMMAFTIALGN